MNPHNAFNSYYPHSYNSNTRDKTKSFFQPNYNNVPYPVQQNPQLTNNNSFVPMLPPASVSNYSQSDKYKSFYTEDYRGASDTGRTRGENVDQLFSKSGVHEQTTAARPTGQFYNLAQQPQYDKSLDRKRFYTVASKSKQRQNHHLATTSSNISQPLIERKPPSNITQNILQNQPSSKSFVSSNKQQTDSKKDLFNFVNQRFSISRADDHLTERQKQSSNRSEYLEKGNKKISLKRDISPKYYELQKNTNFNKTYQNLFSEDVTAKQKQKPELYERHTTNNFSQQKSNPNPKKQPKLQSFKQDTPIDDIIGERGQVLFKKNTKGKIKSQQIEGKIDNLLSELADKQIKVLVNNSKKAEKQQGSYKRKTVGSTSNNNATQNNISQKNQRNISDNIKTTQNNKNISSRLPSYQMIDSEVYTDMKISRIEESTLNLQEKLTAIVRNIQLLSKSHKQQQMVQGEITQYIAKQEEEGVTAQDIKRIKKQLKIIKTNFETAFTSMTQQINRKLVKEEQIMKNLSDQIKLVAEENVKLSNTIDQKSVKVSSLEKSMTSFMRENQERIESLVLSNDSFSSSAKKSRNHSFEYGLELRNASGEEGNANTKQKEAIDNLGRKVESIERQIRKMKVFHIEEKEGEQQRLQQIREDMEKLQNQERLSRLQIQKITRQLAEQMIQKSNKDMNVQINELFQTNNKFINELQENSKSMEELAQVKAQIEALQQTCHDELYQFRLNKFNHSPQQQINPSPVLINSNQIQEKLKEIDNKQRAIGDRFSLVEKRLLNMEERSCIAAKTSEEHKLKEIKHSGDIRQLQTGLKQLSQQYIHYNNFKTKKQTDQQQLSNTLNSFRTTLLALQNRCSETQRVNAIQTQNIDSINNEFERVINKEIIPKFAQIHNNGIQTENKLNNLSSQLKRGRQISPTERTHDHIPNTQTDSKLIQTQIEHYFAQNLNKFINHNVKLLSTKLISSKSPLTKLGLSAKNNLFDNPILIDPLTEETSKQSTYLIDEDGYLMDWQGTYLMELDSSGIRTRIQLTEHEIYFIEINGLQVKKLNPPLSS